MKIVCGRERGLSVLRIEGSYSLDGIIKIQGSKNGVLPVMAASLLHNGTTVLEHIPKYRMFSVCWGF